MSLPERLRDTAATLTACGNTCDAMRAEEAADEIERLEMRRGGECRKCGRWVCPPLTCMACLADASEELRTINADLTAEVERLTRERDALIDLHVERSEVTNYELWDVLLPDSFSMFGFSWTQDIESKAEAVAMLLKAAGLEADPP